MGEVPILTCSTVLVLIVFSTLGAPMELDHGVRVDKSSQHGVDLCTSRDG